VTGELEQERAKRKALEMYRTSSGAALDILALAGRTNDQLQADLEEARRLLDTAQFTDCPWCRMAKVGPKNKDQHAFDCKWVSLLSRLKSTPG
jgi:hypothetical protein